MSASAAGRGSVAILGCGWLGRALARNLLHAGYRVLGSTTSSDKLGELRALGVEAYVVRLPLAAGLASGAALDVETSAAADATLDFWRADQLVLCFPPGGRRDPAAAKTYPGAVLSAVLAYRRARADGRIVFCSSTGIYGDAEGAVTVATPITGTSPRVQALALAEAQVRVQSQRPHVILRLAGLYGEGREPGRFFAGRRDVPDGDAPVNLASQQRVVARLRHYLDAPFWMSAIENVVDPEHPTRREFYTTRARVAGLEPPTFLAGGAAAKLIS